MPADNPTLDVAWCRSQFPGLARQHEGRDAVFFDGPAGSQVPQRVATAMANYLLHTNANHGGRFATSIESDAMLEAAHRTLADFVGHDDPELIVFGANMTSLTFAMSRAIARTWKPGDEVVVTKLDHDANVRPWMLAARDAGAVIREVEVRLDDCTLNLDSLDSVLSARTRLVAVGCASNSVGTINPVAEVVARAKRVGALTYLDAVHLAPHALLDVRSWGCDFLACSPYKFFGPHLGVLWGRRELLDTLPAYKVRPSPDESPGRWMTGTQSHESIVGAAAGVEYLAELGRRHGDAQAGRRQAIVQAFATIGEYERKLGAQLIAGLGRLKKVRLWGIRDPKRAAERVPTVSITHEKLSPVEIVEALDRAGIYAWHGNYYAWSLSHALGREPEGMVRIGLLHYNTEGEVDRLLETLEQLDR